MIKVSDKAKDIMLNDTSIFMQLKVDINIDGSWQDFNNDVMSIDIHEETSNSMSFMPFGDVTSNRYTITLDNSDRDYLASNTQSPYYNKLVAGARFRLTFVLEVEDDIYEHIPYGEVYLDNLVATFEETTATVECVDKLGLLATTIVKPFRVRKHTTLEDCMRFILPNEDVVIKGMFGPIPYFYRNGSTIKENLSKLATMFMCNIYCNTKGQIVCSGLPEKQDSDMKLDDANQIVSISTAPSFNEQYSAVSIDYNRLDGVKYDKVLDVKDSFPIGHSIRPYTIGNAQPILDVAGLATFGKGVISEIHDYTSDGVEVSVYAQEAIEKLMINAIGVIAQYSSHVADSSAVDSLTMNVLKTALPYYTSDAYAKSYCTRLLDIYSSSEQCLTIELFCMPIFELGDSLLINSASMAVNNMYTVVGIDNEYHGGVSTTITAIPTKKLEVKKRVFISPGLSIIKK